jgi:hypothetical protein
MMLLLRAETDLNHTDSYIIIKPNYFQKMIIGGSNPKKNQKNPKKTKKKPMPNLRFKGSVWFFLGLLPPIILNIK